MPNEVRWPRVKEILDGAMGRWKAENGREPRMKGAHDGHIGWETKEELASSAPYEKLLIDPEKVGSSRADETNLIRILRGPIGGYRRMPSGGPYISPEEIKEIAAWIDAGMPE